MNGFLWAVVFASACLLVGALFGLRRQKGIIFNLPRIPLSFRLVIASDRRRSCLQPCPQLRRCKATSKAATLWRMAVFGEAPTGLGWKEHPSTYVLTTQDRVFSPELQRRMSANATRVVEVDAGHIPLLSRPAELAAAIAAAANR